MSSHHPLPSLLIDVKYLEELGEIPSPYACDFPDEDEDPRLFCRTGIREAIRYIREYHPDGLLLRHSNITILDELANKSIVEVDYWLRHAPLPEDFLDMLAASTELSDSCAWEIMSRPDMTHKRWDIYAHTATDTDILASFRNRHHDIPEDLRAVARARYMQMAANAEEN